MIFKKTENRIWVLGYFAVALGIWTTLFWTFLSGRAPVSADAVAFYEHLYFYLTQLTHGVYPLWDPYFSDGSANEFFLRRIGPYNPFLLWIIIPYRCGIPFWPLFSSFLVFYYFLGMTGFYFLVQKLLSSRFFALLAMVILCFSSLGTRLFDSYLMMILTPMLWFFYFLVRFNFEQKRAFFTGMVFCLFLLLQTYIPFYFLIIVFVCLVLALLIAPGVAGRWIKGLGQFLTKNPLLGLAGFLVLGLVCVPGFLFFKSAAQGQISLPFRHFDAVASHALYVKPDVTTYWAIPEDLMYSQFYLKDLQQFNLAVFYLPLPFYIFLFAGLIARVERLSLFCFMACVVFMLLGSPYLTYMYYFLHEHLGFFKYFRNLHFFLWLAVLPLAILMVTAQIKSLWQMANDDRKSGRKILIWVVFSLGALAGYLIWTQSYNWSTWTVLSLSLLFCIWGMTGWCSLNKASVFALLLVVIQPGEAYLNLGQNASQYEFHTQYEKPLKTLIAPRRDNLLPVNSQAVALETLNTAQQVYYATPFYVLLTQKVLPFIFKKYLYDKFRVYDRLEVFDEQKGNFRRIEEAWVNNENVAFVAPGYPRDLNHTAGEISQQAQPLRLNSPELDLIHYDGNKLVVKTHFLKERFLVFNDCYTSGWTATVNSQAVALVRANIAFKGLWVPAGEQTVELKYGTVGQYVLEIILLGISFLVFGALCVMWVFEIARQRKESVNE